jgi:flagellar FliL protein
MAESQGGSSSSGSKGIVTILVILVLISMVGTGVAVFFVLKAGNAPKHTEESSEHGASSGGVLVEFPAIVVNLNHSMEEIRYLKCAMSLEVSDEKKAEKINTDMPRVKNAVILYLSTLRFQDLQTLEDKHKIIKNLHEKINESLGGNTVQKIFITEFVVQ